MDPSPFAVTITITRSIDGRSFLATRPGDGRAVGIGPTPAIAVEELFRWSPQILE